MRSELLLALLVSALTRIVADEAKEYIAWLPGQLIRWAARQFQSEFKSRIEEEWLAHSNDLPGNFAKLLHAAGCVVTAIRITGVLSNSAAQIVPVLDLELFGVASFSIYLVLIIFGLLPSLYIGPEWTRAERLRKAAGGYAVLGLNELDLTKADYYPRQRQREVYRKFTMEVGPYASSAMAKIAKRNLRILFRLGLIGPHNANMRRLPERLMGPSA